MPFMTPFSPRVFTRRDTMTTSDDTPESVPLFTPAPSTVSAVKLRATAKKADGSVGASWEISATVRAAANGTLTLLGASTLTAEADAGFEPAAEVDVSGANIVANLTGIAATSINWVMDWEVA